MVDFNPATPSPQPPMHQETAILHGAREDFNEKGHLLDYWQIIRSRSNVFFSVFVSIVVIVTLYSFIRTPIYQAVCNLMILPSSPRVSNIRGVYDPTEVVRDYQARRDFLQTQMELIRSDHILQQVFDEFEFASMDEFKDEEEQLLAFRELISVSAIRNTFLVTIAFEWKDPYLAQKVTTRLSELYVDDYRKRQLGFAGSGMGSLRDQLNKIGMERKEALKTLLAFKREHHIIDLNNAQQFLILRMGQLNEATIAAQVDETIAKATIDSIATWKETGQDINQIPEALNNPSITSFKLERLRAQAEALGMINKFGPTSPVVLAQKQVVQAMNQAVNDEILNYIEGAELMYERAKIRSTLLAKNFYELEEGLFALDEISADYRIYEDALVAKEDAYRRVANRLNEIDIVDATSDVQASGNISVIDEAAVPQKPAYPRKGFNILLSMIMGVILGAATCLFLDYLDTTVKSKEEVEALLGAPILGFVPHLDGEDVESEAFHSPHCSLAETFRTIRTSIGLSITGRKKRVFAITSTEPGEGKTLCAMNLALTFAQDGKSVLLMEGDMRRPRLSSIFEKISPHNGGSGLSKVLVQETALADIIWEHPEVKGLNIALCGPIPPNPAELLNTRYFKSVLKEAMESYDIVIIDSPPVLNVADSLILTETGVSFIYVVRAFRTDRQKVAMAAERLHTVRANLIGAIINNADTPRKSFYGYYSGGHYHSSSQQTDTIENEA
ncbi:MAG: polysaccharide biosynthesis tyrosine autokinase [Planctomycetes bacterium]|nr:polysaccharide biosynthesis tyrosine autokinase [Planctomycetota bacterium]